MILAAAAGLAAWEWLGAKARFAARRALYERAKRRALQLGRPLIVVGDPDAGAHTRIARAYECGDVCVDLNGCPKCQQQFAADISRPLPFPDDSVVVFVSCVLEYVDDLQSAWRELVRIAGGTDNLFVVRVSPWTITSRCFPGAKWLLYEVPPASSRLVARRISNDPRDGSRLFPAG